MKKFGYLSGKKNHVRATTALFCLIMPTASVHAQDVPKAEPERWSVLTVFGNDECPAAVGEEIVVCVKAPESDRYRLPRNLRQSKEDAPIAQSWNSAVESLDETARPMRPNSCSVVGSGGSTGCVAAALRQWFAERRAQRK
jgi:hypothetical protein